MKLHADTFNYLRPSDTQMNAMQNARDAAREYAEFLERVLPDGADKTDIMRQLRTVSMWVNVCLTRNADGTPR